MIANSLFVLSLRGIVQQAVTCSNIARKIDVFAVHESKKDRKPMYKNVYCGYSNQEYNLN